MRASRDVATSSVALGEAAGAARERSSCWRSGAQQDAVGERGASAGEEKLLAGGEAFGGPAPAPRRAAVAEDIGW